MIRRHELKLALGSVVVCLGILFASLSVFNLLSDNLKLLISPALDFFVSIYEFLFHKPFEAAGLDISDNLKNLVSIYILIGGISSRAIYPNTKWITSFLKKHEILHNTRLREISLITKPFARSKVLTFLYCLILWPIVFYRIYKTPIYLATSGMAYQDEKGLFREVYELYTSDKKIPSGENGFDIRKILLIQVSVTFIIIICLLVGNHILT